MFASLERAIQTRIWTLKAGRKADAAAIEKPITFSGERFDKFYATYSGFTKRCIRISKKSNGFLIKYDQLGDPQTLKNLLAFIGSESDPGSLDSQFRKQFTKSIDEGFTNPAEMRAHLAETALVHPQ